MEFWEGDVMKQKSLKKSAFHRMKARHFGKEFYRKDNAVKRSGALGPFSEPADSEHSKFSANPKQHQPPPSPPYSAHDKRTKILLAKKGCFACFCLLSARLPRVTSVSEFYSSHEALQELLLLVVV